MVEKEMFSAILFHKHFTSDNFEKTTASLFGETFHFTQDFGESKFYYTAHDIVFCFRNTIPSKSCKISIFLKCKRAWVLFFFSKLQSTCISKQNLMRQKRLSPYTAQNLQNGDSYCRQWFFSREKRNMYIRLTNVCRV